MTLQEIKQRLDDEFPDRYVAFQVEVNSFKDNPVYEIGDSDAPATIEMSIYDAEFKSIPCASLVDGIMALKARLHQVEPTLDLTEIEQ